MFTAARLLIASWFCCAALALVGCASRSIPVAGPGMDAQVAIDLVRPASHTTTCISSPCVYVTNFETPAAVYLFPVSSKHKERAQLIYGPSTGLVLPTGIALDADRNVYVSDQALDEIFVYAAGEVGNVNPIRTIAGTATLLHTPMGIAFDKKGRLYVANEALDGGHWSVAVYDKNANGNVAPVRVLSGALTGLDQPVDVAFDTHGKMYVANYQGSAGESISVYAPGANGNVAPLRVIAGSNTQLGYSISIAVDSSGEIYAAETPDGNSGAIVVFAAGASGNVAPVRSIGGSLTELSCIGLTLFQDDIYAGNFQKDDVTVYPESATGNVAPIQVIETNPALGQPEYLVIR